MQGKHKLMIKRSLTGILFVLPAVLLFAVFVLLPAIQSIYMSFFRYGARNTQVFLGLDNFLRLFSDKNFVHSYFNTFKYVIIIVPVTLVISLFASVIISNKKPAKASFYRMAFYIPTIASAITVSLIWNWIYHPLMGVLNYILSIFDIRSVAWLSEPKTALYSIAVVILTTTIGQPIILFSAAIGSIPMEYYEAATIDGASPWQIFWNITMSCLQPTILYALVITTISAFQTFVPVQVLTGGGPQKSTSTIVYELYEQAFQNSNLGYASAIGVTLFLSIGVFAFVQFKVMFKER